MRIPYRYWLVAALLIVLPAACDNGNNFTQESGFAEILASLSDKPPAETDRLLLFTHKPELYIAPNADGPLDFYADYIAHGVLSDGSGRLIENPNASMLNALKHDAKAVFKHRPATPTPPITPVAYGGVYRATLSLPNIGDVPLTFLSYHFAFRRSGLPAGISGWLRFIAQSVSDTEDWHQLDHYTAVFIALVGDKPLAVMLQQHNYLRTYLIGEDDAFGITEAVMIDAAISSNELYPHRSSLTKRRAVGFLGDSTVDYLVGKTDKTSGFSIAADITHGARRVNYELRFLPPNDAFYVFSGYLGERRFLPGRDGPPGAIYRIYPHHLVPPEVSLYSFYWRDNDPEYADILHTDGFGKKSLEKLKMRFALALKASGLWEDF